MSGWWGYQTEGWWTEAGQNKVEPESVKAPNRATTSATARPSARLHRNGDCEDISTSATAKDRCSGCKGSSSGKRAASALGLRRDGWGTLAQGRKARRCSS